jgi:hypothetical protein
MSVLQPLQFLHGTAAELSPGDKVEAGHPTMTSAKQNKVLQNAGRGKGLYNHATPDPMVATSYAERAVSVNRNRGNNDVKPHVYEVAFSDKYEVDPDAGVVRGKPAGYRSTSPLHVLREVDCK